MKFRYIFQQQLSQVLWRMSFVFVGISLVAMIGCGSRETVNQKKLTVLVSVAPQAFLVSQLAGDKVEVYSMIPAGVSAESYEPTMSQLEIAMRARLYVAVGHPLFVFEQVWLKRVREMAPELTVFHSSATAFQINDDPHVWLSPIATLHMAESITEELIKLEPQNQEIFRENLSRFLTKVREVDARMKLLFQPYANRSFLVLHPAWGYFAHEYGLRQLAIETEGKEPGAAQLAQIIAQAKAEGIKTIFVEPQFPRASTELVARELGARVVELNDLTYDLFASWELAGKEISASFE